MTVKMNAAALDDAMLAATSLASRIESARQSALSAVPPGGPSLPSLGAHGIVGTAPEWLRGEAEDPLGVVRDLAICSDRRTVPRSRGTARRRATSRL